MHVIKCTTVFFSGRYGFSVFTFVFAVSDSYPRRSSLFFESVSTTQATMMLAYRSWGFLPLSLVVLCPTPWKSTTTVYLAVYGCCKQQFLSPLATHVLPSIMGSERHGQDSMSAYIQLSHVYLLSTLDVMHVMKCTRLSLSLTERAWKRGYPDHTFSTQLWSTHALGIKLRISRALWSAVYTWLLRVSISLSSLLEWGSFCSLIVEVSFL